MVADNRSGRRRRSHQSRSLPAPKVRAGAHESRTGHIATDERMSATDRAWLEMDAPRNPMIVGAMIELDQVHDLRRLRRTLAERLSAHERFVQCADDSCTPARWKAHPDLDWDYHLPIYRMSSGDQHARLLDAISEEMSKALDRKHPLWRLHLFAHGRSRVSVLFRAHHAMADGISLLRMLLKIVDGDGPLTTSSQDGAAARRTPRAGALGPLIDRLEALNRTTERWNAAYELLRQQPWQALPLIRDVGKGAFAIGRVLALPDRNPQAFRIALSGSRVVDWSRPIPLQPVHGLAHKLSTSVNDVFLSTLAGAIGRHLQERGPIPSHQTLRVSIPVNLRQANDDHLGNCFGLVLLDLPIGIKDRAQRLAEVSRRMRRLKQSGEARAMLLSLAAIGQLPTALEKRLVRFVAGKAAAVVSNLPGPTDELRFCGARIRQMVFWPPQTGDVGIGISLLSYAGALTLGLCCDRNVIAEPHRVVEAFEGELETMLRDEAH